MVFSAFTVPCDHHLCLVLAHFISSQGGLPPPSSPDLKKWADLSGVPPYDPALLECEGSLAGLSAPLRADPLLGQEATCPWGRPVLQLTSSAVVPIFWDPQQRGAEL